MDTKKILELARKDKKKGQEFENKVFVKGCGYSVAITAIISVCMIITEFLTRQTVHFGLVALAFFIVSVPALYEGIKSKKVISLIGGIMMSVIAVLFALGFIGQAVLS